MTWMANSTVEPGAHAEHRGDLGDEHERIELDEDVQADEAEDVEELDAVHDLDARAELHGVGRDREVHLGAARSGCPA